MFSSTYFITIHRIFQTLINARFLPVIVLFTIIFSSDASAQGNVLITPKRLIFDGSKRSEEINLANVGNDTATYAISWVQNRMKEDGSFERITEPDPGQNFADKYLRFFPRTVTLAPGESQTVRVQITKSNELAAGEYRSHLYFRALPKETPLGEKEPVKDSGISVKIVPVFGMSIPMIIRKGENHTLIQLSDVSFQLEKDTIPTLKMTIDRTGDMSVYGDVWVDHISPQGKETRVGLVKGLAVYTPNLLRNVRVLLDKNPSVNYHTGTLHMVYSDPLTVKLAQKEIYLH